jgi:hypothetical protein
MSASTPCPLEKADTLLLATDGSEYSQGAIREAIRLARKCSSALYAMSVVETVTDFETIAPQKVEESMQAAAAQHLEAVKTQAQRDGVTCHPIVAHGDPQQCIVQEAARLRADLVIIGRRGTKGLKGLLIGEVAAKVIGLAGCGVLVVPKAAQVGPRTILIATDGSGHGRAAEDEGVRMAGRCGSSVIALSAIRADSELMAATANVRRVIELARPLGVAVAGLTPVGRSHDALLEVAGGRGVDLIVMGIPVKSALQKIFSGSATEQVIGKAGCAVLVLKGGELAATV